MDNAQKAIMIGVGLFITIIIISAVMLITSAGQDMINDSTQQVGNISSSLEAQLTSQFDETVLTGSQVISAVKSYNTREGFAIYVFQSSTDNSPLQYGKSTAAGVTAASYTATSLTTATPAAVGNLTNKNASSYVPATAKYNAHLIKISGTVVGLAFVKQ